MMYECMYIVHISGGIFEFPGGKKLATYNPTRTRTKFDNNKYPPKSNILQKQVSTIERYLLMINT